MKFAFVIVEGTETSGILQRGIGETKDAISRKEAEIKEKEAEIKEKEAEIKEKEAEIAKKQIAFEDIENEILDKEDEIRRKIKAKERLILLLSQHQLGALTEAELVELSSQYIMFPLPSDMCSTFVDNENRELDALREELTTTLVKPKTLLRRLETSLADSRASLGRLETSLADLRRSSQRLYAQWDRMYGVHTIDRAGRWTDGLYR